MFVQIHTLRHYPVSLPNRGADGLAKRAPYGGVERQRISSQCIKAALREADMKALADELDLDMSVRSALIADRRLGPMLEEAGIDDSYTWANSLMDLWRAEGEREHGSQPIVVGKPELRALVAIAKACSANGVKTNELRPLFQKDTALRRADTSVQDAVHALRAMVSHAGLDGALFGRFATGVAVSNVDSAVHVAHALTVHGIHSVSDFFSVQDQLKTDEEDRGGSHINTAELTSGLFYSYAVVDLDQLKHNFAELTNEQRARIVEWLTRAIALTEPAAKLGSTAPYAGLIDTMVEVGDLQPRSLMSAFEVPVEPVKKRSVSDLARERLAGQAVEFDSLVGGPAHRLWLRDFKDQPPAIDALAAAVGEAVQ